MKATFFFNSMDKEVELKMSYESYLSFMSVVTEVACGINDSETVEKAKEYLYEWEHAEQKTEWEEY